MMQGRSMSAAPENPPRIVAPAYFWRRRRFWLWSFALLVVAVVGFVARLPTTRALVQFHRVRAGMTENEIVELLGPPTNANEYPQYHPMLGNQFRGWVVGELVFSIYLSDGKVMFKSMHTHLPIMRRLFPGLFGRNLL
jgi:hypothetical protein